MIKLNISCESADEARVYLNAQQYYNLIDDFYNALHTARKHGKDHNVIDIVDSYMASLSNAIDNSTGAY